MSYTIRLKETDEIVAGPLENQWEITDAWSAQSCRFKDHYISCENWREVYGDEIKILELGEFGLTNIEHHFLRVASNEGKTLIVEYYEDEVAGRRGTPSSKKIGRYLREFYPELTSDEVTCLAGQISATVLSLEVHFARTRQEIRDLYLQSGECGLGSCMTYSADEFGLHAFDSDELIHPVEAYAGPDLAVAYLKDQDGDIMARALCWPEKMIFSRVYGDSSRFETAMEELGYRFDPNKFKGARLLKLEVDLPDKEYDHSVGYVCPYIDHVYTIHETEDYLVIGSSPDRTKYPDHTSNDSGYIEMEREESYVTGELILPWEERRYIKHPWSGEVVIKASEAVDEEIVLFQGEEWLKGGEDDWGVLGTGERAPMTFIRNYCGTCAIDKKIYPFTEMKVERIHGNREWVYIPNYLGKYRRCDLDGEIYPIEEMVWMEHEVWWHRSNCDVHGVIIDGKNYAKALAPCEAA